jgi:ribonuclease HI
LGTSEEHTVFEAELVGLLLGLQLIKDNATRNLTCAIGIDNQAAIKALASKINKPGHYLAAEVIRVAQQLRNTQGRKFALTIRWTAGHSNIPGNEAVDKEAKKAADGRSKNPQDPEKANEDQQIGGEAKAAG